MSINKSGEETALMQLLSRGDKEAFSCIFREYHAALCAFAEKLTGASGDVEDIVGEVFLKIWNRQQTFLDQRHLKDFLYKATRNACFDYIRRSIHSRERQAQFLQSQEQWEASAELEVIRMEVIRNIYHQIGKLPEQCGKIVRMGYIEGKTNNEIAAELGLSVQTVKNQKSRGISLLKLRLPPESFVLFLLFYRF